MKSDPVGVIGLGLLGRGIAASLLGSGYRVIAFDTRPEAQGEARLSIEHAVSDLVVNGGLSPHAAGSWPARYTGAVSIDALGPCAFLIESVFEDVDVKRQVFDQIEAIVGEEVPIASNTSAIPIGVLQRGRRNPTRFLGMHWAEPAYATRFLEIIRGEHTSDAALAAALDLGRNTGKDASVVNQDLPGFILNRLAYAMYREAASLLELGAGDVATIDRTFRNAFGLWANLCGPFRWIDITGGPALYAKAMSGVLPSLNNSAELPAVFAEKQRRGEKGTLDGRGFYSYAPGDAERWRNLLHEHVWEVRRLQDRYYPLHKDTKDTKDSADDAGK